MGLLDSFLSPDDASSIQGSGLGTGISALGMALLSSNGRAPFASLPQSYAAVASSDKASTSRSALKALLMQAGYSDAEAEKLSSSEGVAKLAIQQKQQSKLLGDGGDAEPALFGGTSGGATPAMSPAAPAGPAAGVSLNGGGLTGDIGAYAGAIKAKESGGRYDIVGPTHPTQGRALGAYQVMESNLPQWSQETLGRTVSPDEFLKSPEIQDAIFQKKFGQSVEKYGNPQDAASVWFTGRPASQGANARDSLGTTGSNYVASFNANLAKQRPTQVADASGSPVAGINPAMGMPNGRPQVADNEQQTQALEGRMGMYPPNVYGITPDTQGAPKYGPDTATGRALATRQAGPAGTGQVASADAADLPAPGAQETGFVIPPGAAAAVEKKVGTPPTPVNENIGPSTQRAQALANFNYWGKRLRASAALGDAGKGLMEEAKIKMGLAQKYLEPSDVERLVGSAGLTGADAQAAYRGAIPGAAPTSLQKEYGTYVQQERVAGRQPMSQYDYDVALSRAKANSVTVGGAEKTYDADQGKTYSGLMTEFQAAGRKAPSTVATLNEAERLMNTPGFVSGVGTERFILPFKQVVAKLGGDANAPAAMETVRALANKAVTDQLGGSLGAGVSNADVSFLQKQNASLDNSVEANKALIGYAKKLAERQREIATMARDYAKSNGGRLDVGFESKLSEFATANPLFPETGDRAPAAQGSNGGAARAGASASGPTAAEMNATDRALSVRRAKEAIQANPRARDAILQRMRDAGLPTEGF